MCRFYHILVFSLTQTKYSYVKESHYLCPFVRETHYLCKFKNFGNLLSSPPYSHWTSLTAYLLFLWLFGTGIVFTSLMVSAQTTCLLTVSCISTWLIKSLTLSKSFLPFQIPWVNNYIITIVTLRACVKPLTVECAHEDVYRQHCNLCRNKFSFQNNSWYHF